MISPKPVRRLLLCTPLFLFALGVAATGAEPYRFAEGKHGKGEMRYVNDLPVMILEGTPEEIGEQHAVLLGDSIKKVADLPKQLIKQHRVGAAWPLVAAAVDTRRHRPRRASFPCAVWEGYVCTPRAPQAPVRTGADVRSLTQTEQWPFTTSLSRQQKPIPSPV